MKDPEQRQFDEFGVNATSDVHSGRVPDDYSERRLRELRHEAAAAGTVGANGIRPGGAPFPRATVETGYYGIHMLKVPQWTQEVPLYFFAGGAAGAAAIIAEAARLTGTDENAKVVRDARTIALAGGLISPVLLVMDLGRPARFLYMLRVFKPQSAMSVGVYIVAVFSTAAFLTKFHEVAMHQFSWFNIAPVRFMQELTSTASAMFGFGMATYTGVLLSATAIPVWNEHRKSIPVHFAMSGLAAATGILTLMGNENRALTTIALMAGFMETAEGIHLETEIGEMADPLRKGWSGALTRLGGLLAGPIPLALRAVSLFTRREQTRKLARISAISAIAGSLVTRFAWIYAGHVSARDYRLPLQLAPEQRGLPDKSQPAYARKPDGASRAIAS
jgi:formate-dependent nitrite reductase membrane component NrfD